MDPITVIKRLAVVSLLCLSAAPGRAQVHDSPFEPLGAAEQRTAMAATLAYFQRDAALPHAPLRFAYVALAEPPKAQVLARKAGQRLPRRVQLQVLHHPSNRAWHVLAELAAGSARVLQLTAAAGQPALTGEEYAAADAAVRAYAPWQAALRTRGLDPALAYLDVWAGGERELSAAALSGASFGARTRLVRCLTFMRRSAADDGTPDNPYDRPVEGLVASVDMNARKVIELLDTGVRAVSRDTGSAAHSDPLLPLTLQAPRGSELQIEGQLVRYRDWQFYAVMQPREGLVLYDVRFRDQGRLRPIAYRLALSELYVPYGLADPTWAFRHAFDVGEYNAGLSAQRLERGRDVPENAQLLPSLFFSDLGPTAENPDGKLELPETLALYERAAGLLWTRTDPTTRKRDSRPARELVASWNCWIGNYIYVFEWIFKLDGSIQVRTELHGTTLNRGTDARSEASAPKVGRDHDGTLVSAPHHQHFLSFRLDLDVEGPQNQVMEMEVAPRHDPLFKNAFDTTMQYLKQEGFRDVDPFRARHWHVESTRVKNAFGKPVGYALEPDSLAFPYSEPDDPALLRAEFARHALWITRQRDAERYAAGELPNQSDPGEGVARFVSPAEPLTGQDVVLWYTTGFTHIARPEDYPVMPGEAVSFTLRPRGFFDANPALHVGESR